MIQTILGAGGSIGIELAKNLPKYTKKIRLVGRNPQKVNETDELFKADLLDPAQVMAAVEGSAVVYLTIGLPYQINVWKTQWPLIMEHVIAACKKHNAKLVFFDNIYMYDKDFLGNMTEETPVNPCSEKGKVRKLIADKLMQEVKAGNLTALIARAADFYGPGKVNSLLSETVFKNYAKGKKANWLGNPSCKHSFTYTPDAGKATAILGNTPDAFGQVWHLPTCANPLTGIEWIENIASEMGQKPKFQAVGKGMLWVLGLFIPIMKEFREMSYQNDRDYVFNSAKFEKRFNFKPTPYVTGIRETAKSFLESR